MVIRPHGVYYCAARASLLPWVWLHNGHPTFECPAVMQLHGGCGTVAL